MSRTLANMIGVLGAGMVGFQKGQDMQADRERRQRDEEYEQEQRERTKREQQRQDQLRVSMAESYAPTTVQPEAPKPDTMDNRDVGQPGEQPVGGYVAGGRMVDGYREGGQRFATKAEADKFAADYNTPVARTVRMADTLGNAGEVKAAADLRTSARQERVGEMQLAEAERAHVKKLFAENLRSAAGDPDAMARIITQSGIGGALKTEAVRSADGKTFMFVKVNPDGTKEPATTPYPNTREGFLQAQADLTDAVPIAQQIEHLRNAKKDEADIRLKNAQAGYYEKAGDAALTRADKTGAGKSVYERMDEVDKLQFNNLTKTAQDIESAIVKAQADGMWQPDSPNAKLLQTRLAATRMQAAGILRKYSDAEPADPVGLRATPGASATTRPMTSMEKVLADMDKTGVSGADVDIDGKKRRIGTPAPAARPVAAAPAGPAVPSTGGDPTLKAMQERDLAAMAPLNEAVLQAKQQHVAAARSGDPQAIAMYAQRLQAALAAREQAAKKLFGNNAERYLQSLPQ